MICCEIQGCPRYASNAAILGTQRFCEVPLFSESNTPPPLVRFDLCEEHMASVQANFIRVDHDAANPDYADVAFFIQKPAQHR